MRVTLIFIPAALISLGIVLGATYQSMHEINADLVEISDMLSQTLEDAKRIEKKLEKK